MTYYPDAPTIDHMRALRDHDYLLDHVVPLVRQGAKVNVMHDEACCRREPWDDFVQRIDRGLGIAVVPVQRRSAT